jgi:hypothetical protein
MALLSAVAAAPSAAAPLSAGALERPAVTSDRPVVLVGHRYRRHVEHYDDYADVVIVERTYHYRRPDAVYVVPPPVTVYPAPVVVYPRPVVVYPPRTYGAEIYDRRYGPRYHDVYDVVRPSSCGVYRYWQDDRCVDARWNKPYLGRRY